MGNHHVSIWPFIHSSVEFADIWTHSSIILIRHLYFIQQCNLFDICNSFNSWTFWYLLLIPVLCLFDICNSFNCLTHLTFETHSSVGFPDIWTHSTIDICNSFKCCTYMTFVTHSSFILIWHLQLIPVLLLFDICSSFQYYSYLTFVTHSSIILI